jgi:hypothetical protein
MHFIGSRFRLEFRGVCLLTEATTAGVEGGVEGASPHINGLRLP